MLFIQSIQPHRIVRTSFVPPLVHNTDKDFIAAGSRLTAFKVVVASPCLFALFPLSSVYMMANDRSSSLFLSHPFSPICPPFPFLPRPFVALLFSHSVFPLSLFPSWSPYTTPPRVPCGPKAMSKHGQEKTQPLAKPCRPSFKAPLSACPP